MLATCVSPQRDHEEDTGAYKPPFCTTRLAHASPNDQTRTDQTCVSRRPLPWCRCERRVRHEPHTSLGGWLGVSAIGGCRAWSVTNTIQLYQRNDTSAAAPAVIVAPHCRDLEIPQRRRSVHAGSRVPRGAWYSRLISCDDCRAYSPRAAGAPHAPPHRPLSNDMVGVQDILCFGRLVQHQLRCNPSRTTARSWWRVNRHAHQRQLIRP